MVDFSPNQTIEDITEWMLDKADELSELLDIELSANEAGYQW